MFDSMLVDFKNYTYIEDLQFKALPDDLKARLLAKTVLVATATGFTSGLLFGSMTGAISFAATAVYVATSALDKSLSRNVKIIPNKTPVSFGAEIGKAVEDIVTDVKCFGEKIDYAAMIRTQQFKALPNFLRLRVVVKTMVVALAAGLTSGILFGTLLGLISFTATAAYVSSSVIDRLSIMSDETIATFVKYGYGQLVAEGGKVIDDFVKDVKRTGEDLLDSMFTRRSDSQKIANEKIAKRAKEDFLSDLSKFVTDTFNEIKFTMSL